MKARRGIYGGHWLYGKGGYSPYLKYAEDGKGTIHFVATEDHPRNFDNSLYHAYLRNGTIYQSNGTPVGPLSTSTDAKIATWELTKIFQGTPDNVAWMIDLELDRAGHPYVLFSCQIDGRGLPRGQGGHGLAVSTYARWDGAAWHSEEIAHAGTRLYPGEDDYSGLGALDPKKSRHRLHFDGRRSGARRPTHQSCGPSQTLRAVSRYTQAALR